jgi:hypothetical protein
MPSPPFIDSLVRLPISTCTMSSSRKCRPGQKRFLPSEPHRLWKRNRSSSSELASRVGVFQKPRNQDSLEAICKRGKVERRRCGSRYSNPAVDPHPFARDRGHSDPGACFSFNQVATSSDRSAPTLKCETTECFRSPPSYIYICSTAENKKPH